MISPSFSLDSSSMTTIGSPFANAASASSIESKENAVRCGGSFRRTGSHGGVEPLSFRREGDVATGIVVCISAIHIAAETLPDQAAALFPGRLFSERKISVTKAVICFSATCNPSSFKHQHSRLDSDNQVSLDYHLDLRPLKYLPCRIWHHPASGMHGMRQIFLVFPLFC